IFCALVSAVLAGDLLGKLFLPYTFAAYRMPILMGIIAVWIAILLAVALKIHARWRARDIEFALRLGRRGKRSWQLGAFAVKRLGRVITSLLQRDLALVGRIFSSAVY